MVAAAVNHLLREIAIFPHFPYFQKMDDQEVFQGQVDVAFLDLEDDQVCLDQEVEDQIFRVLVVEVHY